MSREYTEKDIEVVEGLEAVRLRPGMYIGTTGPDGLHHLIYEVVDNSIDEVLAGRNDRIDITLHKDGSASIEDFGVGIPVAKHHQTGLSTLETVLTILHAGGKFNSETYQVSGGLHGVGVSVVNALSEWLIATVYRDGKEYRQEFKRGKAVSELEVIREDVDFTGTTIHFMPDDEIFTDTLDFDKDVLMTRFKQMAFLTTDVTINFKDERDGTEETFHYDGGIKSYVEFLNEKKQPLFNEVIYFDGERDQTQVEIAIQYTKSYSEVVASFVNTIRTGEGGTHVSGFRSGLTRTVNDYARKFDLLKENEDNFSGDDIREGITAVLSVKLQEPQFEGQTKTKLGNTETRTIVEQILYENLYTFLEQNPRIARTIVNKAIATRQARIAARRARDLSRKRSVLDNATLPGKLSDCESADIEENEVFLVEGDSAGGSAKGGRDNEFQAILPLKGKIMNVEKARIDRVLSSDEIRAMITAFGTGVGEDFDLSKLRYGKIIIMTDADVDGAHIRTLLLTFLYRYMKPLIEKGHVYIAQPPLYGLIRGTKVVEYLYDDRELQERLQQEDGQRFSIQRYKGLGEMNADQLWHTTMDPEKRHLLQVKFDPEFEDLVDETFDMLMGERVAPRREFIEENAIYAENIDI